MVETQENSVVTLTSIARNSFAVTLEGTFNTASYGGKVEGGPDVTQGHSAKPAHDSMPGFTTPFSSN